MMEGSSIGGCLAQQGLRPQLKGLAWLSGHSRGYRAARPHLSGGLSRFSVGLSGDQLNYWGSGTEGLKKEARFSPFLGTQRAPAILSQTDTWADLSTGGIYMAAMTSG
jgi:hypothetical protein